jgi:hypothetical protein
VIRCVEVRLSIPDNEALTAFATLQRLGVSLGSLERSDLYRVDVDDEHAPALAAELRACEGIFNLNKHALREREGEAPGAGEVWVDEFGSRPHTGTVTISGRTLAGVRSLERFTAWRLLDPGGTPADRDVVSSAARALLCNPAFQRARFEEPPSR